MAHAVMRAPLRLLLPLLLPFTAALQRCPSLPHRFDAALPHRLDAALPQRTALGAVAGGIKDAGPADDAAVRAWASQLRAVVAKPAGYRTQGCALRQRGVRAMRQRGVKSMRVKATSQIGGALQRGRKWQQKRKQASQRCSHDCVRHRCDAIGAVHCVAAARLASLASGM